MRTRWIVFAALVAVAAGGRPTLAEETGWEAVGTILRVAGTLQKDGSYRVNLPRKDPPLRNEFGFLVPPSMGLVTYAAFAGSPADATVVGDTCTLAAEINPVVDALRAGKIEVVAIHNHMLGGEPSFVFLHFQGKGDAVAMAKTLRAAWDEMGKPHPLPERPKASPPKPDWKAVSEILGQPGVLSDDGVYKVTLPRPSIGTSLDGRTLPASTGIACWVAFSPCECGLTMAMGDTCLRREEIQDAIDGYRRGGIRVTGLHNHMSGTVPELMFLHFAGEGDAAELARTVRAVWDRLAPAKPQ